MAITQIRWAQNSTPHNPERERERERQSEKATNRHKRAAPEIKFEQRTTLGTQINPLGIKSSFHTSGSQNKGFPRTKNHE
jgi:hypothetical protein